MPWRTALTVCRLAARAPARGGPRRGYRRIGSPGLRERSAVPFQERTRAREVLRPRPVGPSLRREHSVGWRASEATRSTRSVCAITGLPLAWTVETARDAETTFALPLIDASNARGFAVKTAIMDKVYDNEPIHTGAWIAGSFRSRHFARLPLSSVATASCPRASTGSGPSRAPTSSARLRSGDAPRASARPASLWVKTDRLHPRFPRTTERSRKLYCSRGAVEREFRRVKREWAMLPLRVRGLDRVRLHADLTLLARLTIALARARARAVPLAA